MPAHVGKLWVAVEYIPQNKRHFDYKFPIFIGRNCLRFCNNRRKGFGGVFVKALRAIRLDPCKCLFVLFCVIYADLHAAKNLNLIHPLCTYAEILLQNGGITEAACYTH